jgi:putative ABC transport system permease protein
MSWLRRFLLRVRNTVAGRNDYEERLREEIEQHLALQTAENLRAGLSRAEARRRAALKFGSVEAVKEDHRAEQAMTFVQTFFRDIRYGLRYMRRSPGFTAVALLTLALGIGANVSIFSAINGILIEHLPYAHSSRLLTIEREQVAWGITLAEVHAIQEQCPAFQRIAVADDLYSTLTVGDGLPMRRWSSQVSGDFFPMLDVKPLLGRFLAPSDAQAGSAPVAVLSYGLWRDGFGRDQRVVGRDIVADKVHYSIVGVMPERFELGVSWASAKEEGLWTPLTDTRPNRRNSMVIGRVKEGVDLPVARAQIGMISPRLAERFPKGTEHVALVAKTPGIFVEPDVRKGLLILQGAVALVLLLASVNLSALLIARASSRHRELAIRKALGASRSRLVRQLLSESLVLALSGGALGLLLSVWGIRILRAIAPSGTPRLDRMRLDPNVLWFTFAISVFSAILFGLFPALQASVSRRGDVLEGGLSAMFIGAAAHKRRFSRNCLLIVEIALAAVLVVGGALMGRSFYRLMRVDTGVRADHALTMNVELSESSCRPACGLTTQTILAGINSLPGVERAALSFGGPLGGGMSWRSGILLEGSQDERPFDGVERASTPGFFQAAGIRLLRGRDFVTTDRKDVAIVSKEFADRYIGGDPLGKRFSAHKDAGGRPVWVDIAGVVNDTRDRAVARFHSGPPYYTPFGIEGSRSWQVIARTSADPMSLASPIGRVVRSADKAAIITDVKSLEQSLFDSAALPRFHTSLFGMFGLLALILAVIGVYGVTSYSVLQRTQEIAIRMALGARAEDVTQRIVAEGGAVALVGIALGMGVALALTRSIQKMLFETQPMDFATYAGVAALLLVAALAACYLPARTATRVDPITILRHE